MHLTMIILVLVLCESIPIIFSRRYVQNNFWIFVRSDSDLLISKLLHHSLLHLVTSAQNTNFLWRSYIEWMKRVWGMW